MPRPPKKSEDKAKAAPVNTTTLVAPPIVAGLAATGRVVDYDSVSQIRTATVGRLHNIIQMLATLTSDYQRQVGVLLGEPVADAGLASLINPFEAVGQIALPVAAEAAPAAEEKKERKKRTHDPNAPKRPLTPYFLYMQHARTIIAKDLGSEAPKGAVQMEGQRRWGNMSDTEKHGWNNAYQYNLRLYNARVHSYKAGNVTAKDMSDEEALKYADDYSIAMPEIKDAPAADSGNVQDAIAQQLQGSADDSTAKTPKKTGGARKRKSEAAPAAADADTSKVTTTASPDKKRRRSTKADDKEEPKKAAGRKKAKGN